MVFPLGGLWTPSHTPSPVSEPLSFLSLAVAAADGEVDGVPVRRLVAAGLSLLRLSAPLVRALAGRRAAILLPTSPQFLVALAASEGRGAVLVNPLSSPPEIAYQLADAGVGAVFTNEALAGRLPASMPHVLLDAAPDGAQWVDDTSRRQLSLATHEGVRVEGAGDVPGSDDEATIVYTSALDGYSLGAVGTHRNLLANARATIEGAAITGDDHALALLPFSHLFGLVVPALAPLLAGARVQCMPRFHPTKAIELLENERVSIVVGVPAVFAALTAVLARRGTPLRAPALRLCICGGAPLAAALQDDWFEQSGLELRQGYGLTEAGPVCLFNAVALPNRRATLGIPFPGVDVSIQDPQSGDTLPPEHDGEICVRGDNVSPGYLRVRPGERGLARRGEWLRTGDLGVRHADGSFSFRGFLKPMFTRNGFNIYPREIERVVGAMPGVEHVRVEPIPDAARESGIALAVRGAVSEGEVREWCERQLAAYKQPTIVSIG